MAFTEAQRRAIETHHENVMVVAGAGSGKTSVLVGRYLALLDANPDWPLNALVAITFTQKAAQEMRDRVRQGIEARLQTANETSPEAIELWTGRIAEMDSARIDTIHALCASILRANPAEAGVDPGFEVLDETEAYLLLSAVIDDVLRSIVAENHPSLRLFTEYGDSNAVRDMLEQFASIELPELSDDVLGAWQAQRMEAAGSAISWFMAASFQTWEPRGEDWLSKRWSECNGCVERLFAAQTLDEQLEAVDKIARLTLSGGKLHDCWGDEGADSKADLKAIREAAKAIAETYGMALEGGDERAAALIPLWDALIRRVQTSYSDAKFASSTLDFDDLEMMTYKLLRDHEDVRARYQHSEFKHVMVDEFQDTNAAQWAIVRALADPESPGCLFVVGDARQSIYAFRGADVSVFMRAQALFKGLGSDPVMLSESFRTHEPLVNCFNEMFSQILWRDENSIAGDTQIELGEPMGAFRGEPPCDSPPLELLLIEKGDDVEDAQDNRRSEAKHIAERIRKLVEEEQRPIYDKDAGKGRLIHYGDIAILFQAMTSVTLYEEALKSASVPYVTVAGRGYYNRQEVYDLINLLQALYNPADNLALAAVLRSPMFGISDDALLGMRLMRDMTGARRPLWDALSDATRMHVMGIHESESPRVEAANLILSELHALAGRVTIAELLRAALDKTGYLATLTGLPDGARRRGNVEKLVEKAHSSGKVTLGAFRKYIEDMSERETREGEAHLDVEGSVQLMSVHKSKGLEFPVVVLADCSYVTSSAKSGGKLLMRDTRYGLVCKVFDDEQHKPVSPFAYTQADTARKAREEAERRRLLYVAATRAQDMLILSGQVGRGSKDGKLTGRGWMEWLLNAFELHDLDTQPEAQVPYAWGTMRVAFAHSAASDHRRGDEKATGWQLDAVQKGEPIPGVTAQAPALLRQPNVRRDPMARSLAASQIIDLGSLKAAQAGQQKDAARFYYQRLRRRLLHDAPHHIQPVTTSGGLSPRRLGDIVHRALQWWRFPSEADDMEALLRSYAWELGIVRPDDADRAVKQARELLYSAMQSTVYRWLSEAAEVYRELPFVYHTEKRTIYGVIDVLFRRQDGTWGLIDYKTSIIPNRERADGLHAHASRFDLQMGVYAAAVREYLHEMLGEAVVPDAFIHYIRYSETVLIPRSEWEESLLRLEDHIGLLGLAHDPSTVRTIADVGTT